MSFTEASFTITFEHVYKDAIKKECSYCHAEKAFKKLRGYEL